MKASTISRRLPLWHLLAVLALVVMASLLATCPNAQEKPKSQISSPIDTQKPQFPNAHHTHDDEKALFTHKMFQTILSDCEISLSARAVAFDLSPDDYARWERGELQVKDSVESGAGLHEDLNGDGTLDRFLPISLGSTVWILIAYKQKDGTWRSPHTKVQLAVNDSGDWLRNEKSLKLAFSEAQFHYDMQERKHQFRVNEGSE